MVKRNKNLKGGHVFLYKEGIQERGSHVLGSGCFLDGLYLLGAINHGNAVRFMQETNYATKPFQRRCELILDWLNTALGTEHVIDTFYGRNGYVYRGGEGSNINFMNYLGFILPYIGLGIPIVVNTLDRTRSVPFVLIRMGDDSIRLLNADATIDEEITSLDDLLGAVAFLGNRIEITSLMQRDLYEAWEQSATYGGFRPEPFDDEYFDEATDNINVLMAWGNEGPNEVNNESESNEGNQSSQNEGNEYSENESYNPNNYGWGNLANQPAEGNQSSENESNQSAQNKEPSENESYHTNNYGWGNLANQPAEGNEYSENEGNQSSQNEGNEYSENESYNPNNYGWGNLLNQPAQNEEGQVPVQVKWRNQQKNESPNEESLWWKMYPSGYDEKGYDYYGVDANGWSRRDWALYQQRQDKAQEAQEAMRKAMTSENIYKDYLRRQGIHQEEESYENQRHRVLSQARADKAQEAMRKAMTSENIYKDYLRRHGIHEEEENYETERDRVLSEARAEKERLDARFAKMNYHKQQGHIQLQNGKWYKQNLFGLMEEVPNEIPNESGEGFGQENVGEEGRETMNETFESEMKPGKGERGGKGNRHSTKLHGKGNRGMGNFGGKGQRNSRKMNKPKGMETNNSPNKMQTGKGERGKGNRGLGNFGGKGNRHSTKLHGKGNRGLGNFGGKGQRNSRKMNKPKGMETNNSPNKMQWVAMSEGYSGKGAVSLVNKGKQKGKGMISKQKGNRTDINGSVYRQDPTTGHWINLSDGGVSFIPDWSHSLEEKQKQQPSGKPQPPVKVPLKSELKLSGQRQPPVKVPLKSQVQPKSKGQGKGQLNSGNAEDFSTSLQNPEYVQQLRLMRQLQPKVEVNAKPTGQPKPPVKVPLKSQVQTKSKGQGKGQLNSGNAEDFSTSLQNPEYVQQLRLMRQLQPKVKVNAKPTKKEDGAPLKPTASSTSFMFAQSQNVPQQVYTQFNPKFDITKMQPKPLNNNWLQKGVPIKQPAASNAKPVKKVPSPKLNMGKANTPQVKIAKPSEKITTPTVNIGKGKLMGKGTLMGKGQTLGKGPNVLPKMSGIRNVRRPNASLKSPLKAVVKNNATLKSPIPSSNSPAKGAVAAKPPVPPKPVVNQEAVAAAPPVSPEPVVNQRAVAAAPVAGVSRIRRPVIIRRNISRKRPQNNGNQNRPLKKYAPQ